MPRIKLTDQERAARKKASWSKAGKPNPSGMIGTPELWASIAESIIGKISNIDFTIQQKPDTLLNIFGFTSLPTFKELQSARNKLLMEKGIHPDHGGSEEMCRKVLEAYEQLKSRILK